MLYCSIVKKIHKVMLSDVIVNIFNSHMTLYLNITKAQSFHILLRFFPFSQNRQGILTIRLFFHETKDKCPGLNGLPPKRFTGGISLNEKKERHLYIPYQLSVCRHTHTPTPTDVNTQGTVGYHELIWLQIDITQKQIQSWRTKKNR